jgi:hypothetical protein
MKMLKYKRGQTGETITWLIATLIIVGMLICFFYAANLLSKTKTISISSFDEENSGEWANKKVAFANSIIPNKNKEIILGWIDSAGDKNE